MLQPDFKKFCWNCNVGGNNDPDSLKAKCMAEGKYEACSSGNSDCYVTMRKNDGQINMLQSGCKQLAACSAESKQVMGGACRPGAEKGPSHCNYCCDYENCNLEFLEVNNYDPAYTAFEQSAWKAINNFNFAFVGSSFGSDRCYTQYHPACDSNKAPHRP